MSYLRKFLPGAVLLAPLLFAGCYPQTPDYIEEYDIIFTDYQPEFDFKSALTYSVPDSVVLITGDLGQGEEPEMLDPYYGDLIVAQIRENMDARGWTEVAATANPDVILLPSVNKTTYSYTYYYGGYWGWYYPYYGYGYGYPTYTTTYQTGTLLIQMNDPNETSGTGNVPIVWISAINGLAEGSQASITNRILSYIDQAFVQSEYLNK